jgi:hypothetical protein
MFKNILSKFALRQNTVKLALLLLMFPSASVLASNSPDQKNATAIPTLAAKTIPVTATPMLVPTKAIPTLAPTPAEHTPLPTAVPTIAMPTRIPTAAPATMTLTLTVTMTPTAHVEPGPKPLPSASDLRSKIHTLFVEKKVSFCVNAQERNFERLDLVFRDPDDCMLQVFDSDGKLEHTKYWHGSTLTVDGGKVHQNFRTAAPQGWAEVVEFLGIRRPYPNVVSYREIVPGMWIPNRVEMDSGGRQGPALSRGTRISIITSAENVDVSAQFLSGGH